MYIRAPLKRLKTALKGEPKIKSAAADEEMPAIEYLSGW